MFSVRFGSTGQQGEMRTGFAKTTTSSSLQSPRHHAAAPTEILPTFLLIIFFISSLLTSKLHQQETQSPDQTCPCETPCRRSNGGFHQHQKSNVPREHDDHVILSCLLRKIDDLESSLNEFAGRYDQRRDRYSTLRDSAARVIQTRFRSYLVRSLTRFRVGVDPMIRSSKRSLSRDLVRFLHYIDDCAVRRYGFVVGSQFKFREKPQAVGVAEERIMEKLRNRMGKVFVSNGELEELDSMSDESEELPMKSSYKNVYDLTSSEENDSVVVMSRDNERKHGSKTRNMVLVEGSGGKTVSFDENGNVYKVYGDTSESSISEEDDPVSGSKDGNGEKKGNVNEVTRKKKKLVVKMRSLLRRVVKGMP
ncbi:hypothetical protein Bca101_077875 [Brassica carinata]